MAEFIEQIAALVKKYAPQYGIMVHSPIIAQAILESASGTSELARNAHNYFGLKYKASVADDYYVKDGSEQNADGSYTTSTMKWCKFPDMEAGVKGYFDFISATRYANLIGVTDPEEYLKNIKADGYATSLKYVPNLLAVIERYNLTQHDYFGEVADMAKVIVIDAGHGLKTAGKRTLKSIDKMETREWTLNDRIADMLEDLLSEYDCKVIRSDDTTGEKDVSLDNRVKTANDANADVFVSIHHNAGLNGRSGGGTQVYYYSSKSERKTQAQALYDAVVKRTGLVGNRSSKVIKKAFTVIADTKAPAFLLENGFMDSPDDTPIILTEEHAEKTAEGILDFLVAEFGLVKKKASTAATKAQGEKETLYRVQVGAYKVKKNAEEMRDKLKAAGFNAIVKAD